MIWRRSFQIKKIIFDGERIHGVLLHDDCFTADLSEYQNKAALVYIDPPLPENALFRQRLGTEGFEKGEGSVEIEIPGFICKSKAEYIQKLTEMAKIAKDLLRADGSIFFHIGQEYQAELKLALDAVFGEENLVNSIVWRYQTGGKSRTFFSRRHDIIYYYAKSKDRYFNIAAVASKSKKDSRNHMKKGVDERGRAYRSIVSGGKTYTYYDDAPSFPDDVWDDVSSLSAGEPQRTGYPMQRPLSLMERILLSTSEKEDLVADICCGSGSFALAACKHKRRFLALDASMPAVSLTQKRLFGNGFVLYPSLFAGDAMLHAGIDRGLGFYDVELSAYMSTDRNDIYGLALVDQWYAGLINGDRLTLFDGAVRSKKTPQLRQLLRVPMLSGSLAILVVDAYGRQSVWTI